MGVRSFKQTVENLCVIRESDTAGVVPRRASAISVFGVVVVVERQAHTLVHDSASVKRVVRDRISS